MTIDAAGLRIDGRAPDDRPLVHIWNECIGAGRANEALRADWQEQFAEAVDVLGVRSVRFHGLFHDDMFVYRASRGSGFGKDDELDQPIFTFSYVDKVFDFILSTGARPFVELGFMPTALATQTKTVFWWGANASPPNDMNRWSALVSATVQHWIDRYGIEEVLHWRFEVWNEPNLTPIFWTGTKTQYFELYEASVRAIKAIDPRLAVGGPSTSVYVPDDRYAGETEDSSAMHATAAAADLDALDWRPVWIEDFIAWCAERALPIDFITTHTYPTDYPFDANGQATLVSRYVDATADDLTLLRQIVAGSPYPDAEVHITEWSSTPSSRDAMHDTVYAATYLTRAYLRCHELAESLSHWTFTDVFEEGGAGIGPFHGGFGIVNEQGIHKPTFHAFEMLSRLGDRLLTATDEGVITRHSATGAIAALLYNYPAEMGRASIGSCDTYPESRHLAQMGPSRRVRHDVAGLAPGTVFTVQTLDLEHGNPAEAWYRAGSPINLSLELTQHLRETADSLARHTLVVGADGVLHIDVELAPWAVTSITQA